MRILDALYRVFGFMKVIGLGASGIALFLMIGGISLDVVSRNVTGNSLSGFYEIVTFYLMPLAVLPILFFAFSQGVCPRIPMVFDRLPAGIQKPLHCLVMLFEFALMSIVAYYSLQYALDGAGSGHEFSAGGTMYPKYPVYFLIPFAFAGMALELAFIVAKNVLSRGVWITYSKDQETIKGELQLV